jgi:hypothetical protein
MTLEEYQKAEADKRAAFKAQFAKGVANRDADASLAKLKVAERLADPESEVFFQGKTESDAKKGSKTKEAKKVRPPPTPTPPTSFSAHQPRSLARPHE